MRTTRRLWQPPTGLQLFASPEGEARARRPTDVALAIASFLVLLIAGTLASVATQLDEAVADLLSSLPGFLDGIWRVVATSALVWAGLLLIISVVRRRTSLVRDLLFAALIGAAVAVIAGEVVVDDGWGVLSGLFELNDPPAFPPGLVTLTAAAFSTASPHLTRPFRHLGRWLLFGQAVAVVALGAAVGFGAVAAVAIGLLAAAGVHLAFGSPGGRPDAARIRLALQELGVDVDDLTPSSMQPYGAVLFDGHDADGPLLVKVYGRDAWDGQLLSTVWRLVWYRDTERLAQHSRFELVEHEGFVTVLAERTGARVPHLVTAGSAGRGDALVVVRPVGEPLGDASGLARVDETGLAALWSQLALLHDAGITHRQVDLDRIVRHADGTLGFGDLSSASVTTSPARQLQDQAQVLALSIAALGEERALAVARTAVGAESLPQVLPYLQDAAVPPRLRAVLQHADVDLDEVRVRFTKDLGAPDQPLIRLRRVTWGSLINVALLAIAAFTLIGLLGDLDLESFAQELKDASWWWLAFAVVIAQLPRVASAFSTMGSIARPLPLGPLVSLQFAITYVNLAIPSTAARVAISVRFFQRFGVGAATAMTAGVIDSVAGLVVQVVLLVTLFFFADLDFNLQLDPDQLSGLVTIGLIVIAVMIVAVLVCFAVPAVRRRLMGWLRQGAQALAVLKSPTKLMQLILGNLVAQIFFAVALGACVVAFGEDVSLSQLIVINTMVSLFAGLMPVPGGIGVAEAGLTLGLTAAGLDETTAFAIALAYRFASFYLPPLWGALCYRSLIKKRYL